MNEMIREHSEAEVGVNVTAATPNDVYGIEEVRYRVWRSTYPQIAPEYISVNDVDNIFADKEMGIKRGIEAITHNTDTTHVLVAKEDDRIAGFSIGKIHSPELGEILSLYVLDDYQGRGIGRMLMIRELEWLEAEKRQIKLEVIESNKKAINFYHKFGFELSKRLPKETPAPPLKYIPHIEMIRQPAVIE